MRRFLIFVAILLGLAIPAAGGQDDPRLGALFDQLKAASGQEEAGRIERQIWQIWGESGNEDVDLLMQEGVARMNRLELPEAAEAFSEVIERAPRFAEGWNKRATVYFLMDDYNDSIQDIQHTLALEPRHFGALSGLGQICLGLDKKQAALKAFEAALAIDPHLASVRQEVDALKNELAGRPT